MSSKTIGLMLGAAVAALMAAPVRADTDTMKSGTLRLCGSPATYCSGQSDVTYFPQRGSVLVAYRHRGHDEDRYSISFSVEIKNDTRCRLYIPGMFMKHGDNIMALDPGGIWVEPGERRESVIKEFGMSEEASRRLESAELDYDLALSDCED